MDAITYLNTIGIANIEKPTLDFLKKIHLNHLTHIPFENQELYLYGNCTIAPDKLYEKVITSHEGGICYQLNYLLYHLLLELGFKVNILSAFVEETEYDHLFLKVTIDNLDYLCDVGYGLNYLNPLPFVKNQLIKDLRGDFYLTEENDIFTLSATFPQNKETYIQYRFKNSNKTIEQFKDRINFYKSSEQSKFTKNFVLIKEDLDNRFFLKNNSLKIGLNNQISSDLNEESMNTFLNEIINFDINQSTLKKIFSI